MKSLRVLFWAVLVGVFCSGSGFAEDLDTKRDRFEWLFPSWRLRPKPATQAQIDADRRRMNDPSERQSWVHRRIATAIVTILDKELVSLEPATDRSLKSRAIRGLGEITAPYPLNEGLPLLVTEMDYKVIFTIPGEMDLESYLTPATNALISRKNAALPILIQTLASTEVSESMRQSASTAIYNIVSHDIDDGTQLKQIRFSFGQYRDEYHRKSERLSAYEQQLNAVAVTPQTTLDTATATAKLDENQDAQIERLMRVLELDETLADDKLTPADEAKVVQAIQELTLLHNQVESFPLLNTIPLLVDKLDWEFPLKLPDEAPNSKAFVMRPNHQGLHSPAITEAAMKALATIGQPALPALIDGLSTREQGPRYSSNALKLIAQICGSAQEAQKQLEAASQEDEKRSRRLQQDILNSNQK